MSLSRALIPILPLFLLVLTVPQFGLTTAWLPKGLSVLQAMVIGVVVTALVAKLSPSKVVKRFFDGMGEAYAMRSARPPDRHAEGRPIRCAGRGDARHIRHRRGVGPGCSTKVL